MSDATSASPPAELHTARLTLRRWRVDDAPLLKAALDPSTAHLKPWIPWSVAEPSPLSEIEARLAGYTTDFDAGREWLYGIFPPDEREVLGGIGLYPRVSRGRVPFAEADRVEVGYWLHVNATGQGYATEAAQAIVDVAGALPGIVCVEIRCDPRNTASVAIPTRLGFRLAQTVRTATSETMVWELVG